MAKMFTIIPEFTNKERYIFWANVLVGPQGKCWPWQSYKTASGYGRFWTKGYMFRAHRIVYYLTKGIDPRDLCVCHSCDNEGCCNPDHLWLGSPADNNQDKANKGRVYRPYGAINSQAVLTEGEVLEIRDRYPKEGVSHQQIGIEYGVSRRAISFILSGETWPHLIKKDGE